MIHAHIQTVDYTNQSLHWTQQYAVKNRIVEPKLSQITPKKAIREIELCELLPVATVQKRLIYHWAILVSRVICKYLKVFQAFRDVVIYHIPHKYSKKMSEKSESVSNFCNIVHKSSLLLGFTICKTWRK